MIKNITLAILLSVPTSPLLAADPDLAEVFEQNGLRPVAVPAPAPDFSLPMLQGSSGSLSDFGGNWIVLTFWATWCGPCRAELPSLEQVHQQSGDTGIAVIGVSLDSRSTAAVPFVEEFALSFPNFIDESGQIGAIYRASSIPLTYIIDPLGRIQAISRGARDWTRLMPMLESLRETFPSTNPQAASFGEAVPVDLGAVQEPPSGRWKLSAAPLEVGKPFNLEIEIKWAGHINDYLLQPPVIHLPEAVSQEGVTASTSSRDGENVLTYNVALRAREVGVFSLDPVELRFVPQFEAVPQASRLVGPEITVQSSRILGLSKKQIAYVAGGSLGVGVLGLLGVKRARTRASRSLATTDLPYQRLRSRLDQATELRLHGRSTEAVQILAAIETELNTDDGASETYREGLVERARYGGQVPASGEIDLWQRRIEKRLAELEPDAEAADRENLKYRKT
jgi:peroxiredoxin